MVHSREGNWNIERHRGSKEYDPWKTSSAWLIDHTGLCGGDKARKRGKVKTIKALLL